MNYQALKRHDGNLKAKLPTEEANLKSHILCNSKYMTLWKKQNYGNSKMIIGLG